MQKAWYLLRSLTGMIDMIYSNNKLCSRLYDTSPFPWGGFSTKLSRHKMGELFPLNIALSRHKMSELFPLNIAKVSKCIITCLLWRRKSFHESCAQLRCLLQISFLNKFKLNYIHLFFILKGNKEHLSGPRHQLPSYNQVLNKISPECSWEKNWWFSQTGYIVF